MIIHSFSTYHDLELLIIIAKPMCDAVLNDRLKHKGCNSYTLDVFIQLNIQRETVIEPNILQLDIVRRILQFMPDEVGIILFTKC
ncbi:hypothetical protein D3C73_1398620 [compost metagenome]